MSSGYAAWPRISVVTPSFNQGRFLRETMESIHSQGYPNLEHIVIDGGSTDESTAILAEYDSRLAFWVSEKDQGQT
ncbi:MAG: glycosyltransferase, partial [Actinomycetota bacterium]|nr:glycosyltransferase [Actinomycetota bacterium]